MGLPGHSGNERPGNKKNEDDYPERHREQEIEIHGQARDHDHHSTGDGINGTGSANDDRKIVSQQEVQQISDNTTDEIHQEQPGAADQAVEEHAEEKQRDHITENMTETRMDEHAGDKRPGAFSNIIRDETKVIGKPVRRNLAQRAERVQAIAGQFNGEKQRDVGNDERPDRVHAEVEPKRPAASLPGLLVHIISIA